MKIKQFVELLKDLTCVAQDLFGSITVVKKRRQKSYADSVGADLDGNVELNGNDFLGISLSLINTITTNIIAMSTSMSGINLTSYKKFDKNYKFSYDEENFRAFFEDIYRHLYNILKLIFCAINNASIPLDQQNAQLFVNLRNCLFLSLFLNKQKAFAQFFKLICQTVLTKESLIDQRFNFNCQIFFFVYDNFLDCLNVSCWEYLIYYLHLSNHLINNDEEKKENKASQLLIKTQNTANTQQTHQTEHVTKPNQTENDDHEIQINSFVERIKNFFKVTQNLSSKQLNGLIIALENSTYDMLEDHEALNKTSQPSRHFRSESVSTPQLVSPTANQAVLVNQLKRSFDETFTLSNNIYKYIQLILFLFKKNIHIGGYYNPQIFLHSFLLF